MALFVIKFGGTSVGDVERIRNVAKIVTSMRDDGHEVVVVLSAMSGETDRLIALAKEASSSPSAREMDVLVSTGEQVTVSLLAMMLVNMGYPAKSYTGGQVQITTDSAHGKARILSVDDINIRNDVNGGRIVVVAGFQGVNEASEITTLGRGGSDTTAVALAAALRADECQIYTDVDGVFTADPRLVPDARRLDRIIFEEMLELASLGAKVLQIRAVEFASKYDVPLRVLSTFGSEGGTLITPEDPDMETPQIAGVAHTKDEAKITVLGVSDRPGVAWSILNPVAAANVEVDMIVQNAAEDGSTDFTFTVHRNDYEKAVAAVRSVADELGARDVVGDTKIAKISLVGVGMRSHAGIASTMFGALAEEGINIQMISTSEIKISAVVDEKYLELGVRALHSAFELESEAVG